MKKYLIIITLKKGILDNAGKAVTKALASLGFNGVDSVRIGKTIHIETDQDIEKIAKTLTNEVMEDYTIEEITKFKLSQ